MNLTYAYANNLTMTEFAQGHTEVYVVDMVRDFCFNMNESILYLLLIILTFYVARNIVLPRARRGFIEMQNDLKNDFSIYIKLIDFIDDKLETFSLVCAIFLTAYWVTQNGWNLISIIWVSILGILVALCYVPALTRLIRKVRR